jgi:hypothetical protein
MRVLVFYWWTSTFIYRAEPCGQFGSLRAFHGGAGRLPQFSTRASETFRRFMKLAVLLLSLNAAFRSVDVDEATDERFVGWRCLRGAAG